MRWVDEGLKSWSRETKIGSAFQVTKDLAYCSAVDRPWVLSKLTGSTESVRNVWAGSGLSKVQASDGFMEWKIVKFISIRIHVLR
jgi:hypothetical protein